MLFYKHFSSLYIAGAIKDVLFLMSVCHLKVSLIFKAREL